MTATGPQVEAICAEAAAATGLDDFGDGWFLGPLSAWVEDLAQANLNDFGRTFLRRLVVRDVARRLRILATLRDNPAIDDVPVPPIVYITGPERSGTTMLHNLLALHPRARAFRRWELMEPLPPPTGDDDLAAPRIAKVQASLDRLRGSQLERMHWVDAEDPEECVWGFVDALSLLGWAPTYWMPAWARFLAEEDLTPAFRNYRRVVQLLTWKHGVGDDGFLVLKAPQVGFHVAEFAAVFPEAWFVITDRDPFRCAVSQAALFGAIAEPFCHENPLADDGRRDRRAQRSVARKLAAVGAFSVEHPDRAFHVPYAELVTDTARTIASIVDAAPCPPADVADAVLAFLASQRSGRRAAPFEHLDPRGYERDGVWSEPAIASYCERFGVVPEKTRLVGW